MTVITDRVLRHVCRKAWWNIERESARRSMGGRGTSGRETKASTRAGVTKYPGPEGEIKAGSFPRWDPSIEGGKGIREKEGKKPVFGNRYHRCRSERPMPFNRLISLRRQNSLPHCCLSHNWLLPRVTVLAPRKNSKNRPFFRSSPLLFFLPFLSPQTFPPQIYPSPTRFVSPPPLFTLLGFIPLDFRSSSLYILKYRDGEIVLKNIRQVYTKVCTL